MLRTLLVTILPIIAGYLLPKVDAVESLFRSYALRAMVSNLEL